MCGILCCVKMKNKNKMKNRLEKKMGRVKEGELRCEMRSSIDAAERGEKG